MVACSARFPGIELFVEFPRSNFESGLIFTPVDPILLQSQNLVPASPNKDSGVKVSCVIFSFLEPS